MATETHPSSSTSSDNYDVFLSFSGEDTRRNFTDHLYTTLIQASIRTFRDNEELIHGEEIGPRLLTAIEQSRISIPIFSKNYASSKWCLQELTKMMECKETCGQIVWPIFYKVEPSHVRNQTGCFEEAFLKHEKEQCGETMRAWRKALKEVANLKGWDSEDSEYRYETNLINSVIERALSVLSIKTNLQVVEHPTGIDSHVKEVERMLDFQSEGVQFVGIHGMGGIGKTTTAKAVFNTISNQFESRRFLEDVREKASQYQGLVNLQKELVSDLLKGRNPNINSVSSGIDEIKKLVRNKKVLIVLDDVDQDEQLRALAGRRDWFGSGSRIIITTRDEHILHVDQVDKSKIYKPNELDGILSLQLFCKHAFGRDQPPQDFMELSKRVVSSVGGLPLALEVLGSFLRDKREDTDWEDTLMMLKKFPNEQVQKKLKISYDGLNPNFKELFLDIACFFIGMDKESVIPALEVCDYFPKVGIKVLVHKSLVKIDSDNKLRMHDQLRDMGREIVRQENPKKPGERSRLWSHKEALDVLKKHEGTRNVEGLFLDFGYEVKNYSIDFDYKAFEVMSDLRLLQVYHADHDGNYFEHLPQGLKWLSLKGISSKCVPTISHLEKLVVLDLSQSDITTDWNGWQQIQWVKTLKVLDLSWCPLLESTPDLSNHTGLERLILDCCESLVALHESIRHLYKLVFLSLNGCNELTELPDSICKLNSIKSLILSDCCMFEKLPKELGNIESLRELFIDNTGIKEIPDSIGLLEKLERLSASNCDNLTELPDSICKLSSIRSLILSYCHKLVKLPKELGNMESLTELIIDWSDIKEIPDSIGLLEKLERLSASHCHELKKLPNLSNLKSLQALCLSDYKKLFEIQGISGLSLPQQLDLEDCKKLKLLHELPPGLIKLNIRDCTSMERLPNLSTLKILKELRLDNCYELAKIEGIDGLTLLQELDLTNYKGLQSLPELPSSLIKPNATNCSSMERLPNLSTLKILKELRLDNCYELAKIEGIDGLTLLQELDLTNCEGLQTLPELPSSLIKLNATSCKSIERLLNLSNMKNLQALLLRDCEKLSKIQGISDLPLLQQLDLKRCFKLQSLPELPPSLIRIDVSSCYALERLPNLSTLKHLKEFSLVKCLELAEIEGIDGLTLLQELDLKHCRKLQSLPELPSSLIKLDATNCHSIERLPNLSNLKSLQVLHLCCMNLSEIQDISGLSVLQELDLEDCKMLQSLAGLPPSLIRLDIKDCMSMERLTNLSRLKSLKILLLYKCTKLANVQSINDLTLLQTLHLKFCEKLQSLDLSNLNFLENLLLECCPNLAEIRGLESLESLIDLQVCGCHTYVKTLPKSVAEGMLPTAAFKERLISKTYLIPDDDNIKGTIFYFVYPTSPWLTQADDFTIEAEIQRNDGEKMIRCVHDLRIEGMNANTNDDRFYSCYFQGLTWFGFPLKKTDKIHVRKVGFRSPSVFLKMLDMIMEYEAMEDNQQLEERVIRLITPATKKRPREYDDADPSNWKLCLPRGMTDG